MKCSEHWTVRGKVLNWTNLGEMASPSILKCCSLVSFWSKLACICCLPNPLESQTVSVVMLNNTSDAVMSQTWVNVKAHRSVHRYFSYVCFKHRRPKSDFSSSVISHVLIRFHPQTVKNSRTSSWSSRLWVSQGSSSFALFRMLKFNSLVIGAV